MEIKQDSKNWLTLSISLLISPIDLSLSSRKKESNISLLHMKLMRSSLISAGRG